MPTADENVRREVVLGDLSLLIDHADVRYVRWRDVEIIRRIYVTVRDEDWDTPAAEVALREVVLDSRSCTLTVEAASRSASVDVRWAARVQASPDGALAYEARFTPQRSFRYSRMGLCVLFPPAAVVGQPYEAWAGDRRIEGRFEPVIAPQLLCGDEILPLIPAFDRLRVPVVGVGTVELSMAGDLLEIEDQRNWSDGSFKAFCTPLSVPRPQSAGPERLISQRVEITVTPETTRPRHRRARPDAVAITIGPPTGTRMPAIGTLVRDLDLSDAAIEELQAAKLEHLRVELRRPEDLTDRLVAAAALARRVGSSLVPVLFFEPDTGEAEEFAELLVALDEAPARILVFPREHACEQGERVAVLREALRGRLDGVPIVGGTDIWFVDLNRARPDPTLLDGVAWSITPEVHAEDDLTMVEGLEAQRDQVLTAETFAPRMPRFVGPITLRPRYNPNARDAQEQTLNPPPSSNDLRQPEPFAAAWTVGSLAALAGAGVDAATYFEAAGPRGVMDTDGRRYPVWQVLATAASWAGRPIVRTHSEWPLQAQALATATEVGSCSMILANLCETGLRVRTAGHEDLDLGAHEVATVVI